MPLGRPTRRTWPTEGHPHPLARAVRSLRDAVTPAGGLRSGSAICIHVHGDQTPYLSPTTDRRVHAGAGTAVVSSSVAESWLMSASLHISAIWPSTTRYTSMPVMVIRRPLGGMPKSVPPWTARVV